ncbi:MAG: hypothetical protein NW237_14130 [Cyanobacteriota bacterium]|nr:hypothetical protein [Cyanobacteriota bacterium]
MTHYLLLGSLLLGLLACGSDTPSTLTTPGDPDTTQVWFEGDPTTFDSTDAAIAFGIAVLKEPPNSIANPVNDQIRVEVESRFGISLSEQQLNSSNGFVLAAADLDGNGQVNSQDAAVAFAVAVLREPPNNVACPSKVQVQTEVERRFGFSVTLLKPIPCSGSAFPPGIPSPDVTPSAEASEPPTGTIQIIGVEDKDGIPLTIGETLRLEAVAIDAEGRDISQWIEWRNPQNQVMGRGAVLDYPANSVVMETLTAQIGEDQSKAQTGMASARVSFTVSTPEAVIAPHVKVLPEQAQEQILLLDFEKGLLQLADISALPTLRVGDVVLGAGVEIPPHRISQIEAQDGTLSLTMQPAYPQEVIRQGKISQWQQVRLDSQGKLEARSPLTAKAGCAGAITKSLDLPIYSQAAVGVGVQVNNSVNGFQAVESQLTTSLEVRGIAEVSLCPVFEPPTIEFNEEGNLFSGIRRFAMGAGVEDITAQAYLQMQGLLEWGFIRRIPTPAISLVTTPTFYLGQVGPVSVWVSFEALGHFPVEAGVSLSATGVKLGVGYGGGSYLQRITYQDEGESGKWENTSESSLGTFSPILEGDIDLDGYIQVGFNPEIETSLWGSPPGLSTARLKLFVLPKIGLNFYVRGEVELLPDEIGVEIEQPQSGTTLAGNESIALRARASGDPKLTLLAGVDLTLRDGSVEDGCSSSYGAQENQDNEYTLLLEVQPCYLQPNGRHWFNKISGSSPSKDKNTVMMPDIDVYNDVSEINEGKTPKVQGIFTLSNGRKYSSETTSAGYRLVPEEGPGFFRMDRGAYTALTIIKKYHGITEAALNEINLNPGITDSQRDEAITVYELGVSLGGKP